jgi:hypothetical protein
VKKVEIQMLTQRLEDERRMLSEILRQADLFYGRYESLPEGFFKTRSEQHKLEIKKLEVILNGLHTR